LDARDREGDRIDGASRGSYERCQRNMTQHDHNDANNINGLSGDKQMIIPLVSDETERASGRSAPRIDPGGGVPFHQDNVPLMGRAPVRHSRF